MPRFAHLSSLQPLNIVNEFHIGLVKPMVLVNLVAIYTGRSNITWLLQSTYNQKTYKN